jgi:hypothetical protein
MCSLLPLFVAFVGSVPQNSTTYHWQNVEIVGGGFVSGLSFHPRKRDLIYARTDIGGAYRWEPHTQRWTPLQDWLSQEDWNLYGVESIGLDPSDANRLYLAVGTYTNSWGGNGAILRSKDQGRHFERTNLPFKLGGNEDGRSIGERLAVDPNSGKKLYFGSRHNGLWTSEDFGATWRLVPSLQTSSQPKGIGIGWVIFDTQSGKRGQPTPTLYAAAAWPEQSLYVSQNAGQDWFPVAGQPTGMIPHHGVLTSDGRLYITYGNGPGPNGMTDGAVWEYTPKTSRWRNITPIVPTSPGEHGFGYAGLAVNPKNPNHLLVSTMDRWNPGDDVFSSDDAGKSWRSFKAAATRDSSLAPFLKWNRESAEFGHWIGDVEMDPFDPNHVLYVTGATIWGTNEATHPVARWTVRAGGLEETAVIDLINPSEGAHVISGLGDIGGFVHWDLNQSPAGGMLTGPMLSNTDSLDYAALKPSVLVRVGRAGRNEAHGGVSNDGGKSWIPFATEPAESRGSGDVALSADGKTIVWTPDRGLPHYSVDQGRTWTASTGIPTDSKVVSDRVNPARFYALDYRTGTLFASRNSGQTFQPIGPKLALDDHSRLHPTPGVEGDLWLTTQKGLIHSLDGGNSFQIVPGISQATSVGFGKSPVDGGYPALFLIGTVKGVSGIYRSYNIAKPWVQIDDANHRFGTVGTIVGDLRIVGRCYLGTNGRGVLYGDPQPVKRR